MDEFLKLIEEYMNTLDDVEREEYYATQRGIVERAYKGFVEWLNERNAQQMPVGGQGLSSLAKKEVEEIVMRALTTGSV